MSNLTFKAPVDIYVNDEYKETVERTVIHRVSTPYARYEKRWHELTGVQRGNMIRFSIFIERNKGIRRNKDDATT